MKHNYLILPVTHESPWHKALDWIKRRIKNDLPVPKPVPPPSPPVEEEPPRKNWEYQPKKKK